MKKFRRAAWIGFAGLCVAGLVLLGGERYSLSGSDASAKPMPGGKLDMGAVYCPVFYFGQFNGSYVYNCSAIAQGQCQGPFTMADTRPHTLGTSCLDCPDPILTRSQPLQMEEPESSPTPKPDPLFSGVLR